MRGQNVFVVVRIFWISNKNVVNLFGGSKNFGDQYFGRSKKFWGHIYVFFGGVNTKLEGGLVGHNFWKVNIFEGSTFLGNQTRIENSSR